MSRIGRAAARLALRLHPTAWRARYAPEVEAGIDDSDSSVADAADLARSALRQHLSGGTPMRLEPAYRNPTGWAVAAAVLLLPTFLIVVLSLIGHELGVAAVAAVTDPFMSWLDAAGPLDLLVVVAPLGALLVAVAPLLDRRVERLESEPAIAVRIRALAVNLVVATVALLTGVALLTYFVTEAVLHAGG